jgi:hypothetical protein
VFAPGCRRLAVIFLRNREGRWHRCLVADLHKMASNLGARGALPDPKE